MCLLSSVLSFCLTGIAYGSEVGSGLNQGDVYEMSLEEAINTEIVSASRQGQATGQVAVPVTLITAEDIHYSGLTTIPEILQFAAGVDVFAADRTRYAVGVRGLHDYTSDRVLILINGRRAESAFFGGSEFWRYPLMIEDIERIEVVRGPGGAAWGANAFNGVINIITKKAVNIQGGFVSSTVSEFGDTYTHLRWAEIKPRTEYRISAAYIDVKSSDDAGAGDWTSFNQLVNDLIGFGTEKTGDFSRSIRFDGEGIYKYSDWTKILFGAGYSHDNTGTYELGGYRPIERQWFETARPFIRMEHEIDAGITASLQWSGYYTNSRAPSLFKWRIYEDEVEGQLNFEPVDSHSVSIGANIRQVRLSSTTRRPQELYLEGEPYDERFVGVFAIDRWEVSDRLTLETQIRSDYYSETQTDWSGRLSALVPADEAKAHMLRFSAAKAWRAPLIATRHLSTSRVDIDPFNLMTPDAGPFAFNIIPNDDLKNEELYSLEAGYTGQMAENLTVAANTYYQTYKYLIGYEDLGNPFTAIYRPENIDGATAYGVELEVMKKFKAAQVSAWYAYNIFDEDRSKQNVRSFAPPENSIGMTGRLYMADGFVFNTNYRYSGNTRSLVVPTTPDIDSVHRLDFTLSKKILGDSGEIMLGIADLLNKTNGPNGAMGQITAHETPGRMVFARLQTKY